MSSGLPLIADIAQYTRHVSKVPIATLDAWFEMKEAANGGGVRPLLVSKTEFDGISNLRTHIRIVPICGTFQSCKLRPQRSPALRPFLWAQVVTKPPALPRCFNEKQGASRGALAKIISTNVPVKFLCRLDDRRFDVSRGARVYRSACARIGSGLDRRAGTSLRYASREWNCKQPDQNERGRRQRSGPSHKHDNEPHSDQGV